MRVRSVTLAAVIASLSWYSSSSSAAAAADVLHVPQGELALHDGRLYFSAFVFAPAPDDAPQPKVELVGPGVPAGAAVMLAPSSTGKAFVCRGVAQESDTGPPHFSEECSFALPGAKPGAYALKVTLGGRELGTSPFTLVAMRTVGGARMTEVDPASRAGHAMINSGVVIYWQKVSVADRHVGLSFVWLKAGEPAFDTWTSTRGAPLVQKESQLVETRGVRAGAPDDWDSGAWSSVLVFAQGDQLVAHLEVKTTAMASRGILRPAKGTVAPALLAKARLRALAAHESGMRNAGDAWNWEEPVACAAVADPKVWEQASAFVSGRSGERGSEHKAQEYDATADSTLNRDVAAKARASAANARQGKALGAKEQKAAQAKLDRAGAKYRPGCLVQLASGA